MKVSDAIPNLVNGISQQPASHRLASQGEAQENAFSSIVEGLRKRNPTSHLAKLTSGELADAFVHIINRDTVERYVVIITRGSLRVFDFTGAEKTVVAHDATAPSREATDYRLLDNVSTNTTGATHFIAPLATETTVDVIVEGIVSPNTVVTVEMSVDGAAWDAVANTNTDGTLSAIAIGSYKYVRATAIGTAWALPIGTTATISYENFEYLSEETPSESYRAVTIADFTFIVNKNREVVAATWGKDSAPTLNTMSLVYVRQGNYGTAYAITISGNTYTKITSNSNVLDIDTGTIAANLATLINADAGTTGFSAAVIGSVIQITRNTAVDYSLEVKDGNGNRNLVRVKDTIQKFTDLPNRAPNGFTVEVAGDSETGTDDYYVRFTASGSASSEGSWVETAKQDLKYTGGFAGSTMPHVLVRKSNGEFFFGQATGIQDDAGTGVATVSVQWATREAGDRDTNPDSSFVGTTIQDIFFFRNRLGLLADENVILSKAGEFFNFFRTTVTQLLDGDPIDVAASNVQVSILKNAVPFQKKLVVFSDQRQFVLNPGELLTPKTVNLQPTTVFESETSVHPVVSGKNIYFPTPRGESSGVREYFVDENTLNDDAGDVTAHVPSYVPSNIVRLTAATNEDVVVALSSDDRTRLYVYKYYWGDEGKLQSSWSKWTMPAEVKILDCAFIGPTLYMVIQREDGVYLESMGIEANREDIGFDFEVLLDRKITESNCTVAYNTTTDETDFTLPYAESGTMQMVVRTLLGDHKVGSTPTISRPAANKVRVKGDYSGTDVYLGLKYQWLYTFSKFSLKDKSQTGGEKPLPGRRLQIKTVKLLFDRTGYFKVQVTPTGGSTFEYIYNPTTIGITEIGEFALASGEFTFPVRSKNDRVTITMLSDSWLPVRIQSAVWEGEFLNRGGLR